ncbi:hypothetical protein FIBSPDRAFT_902419 [Athelia psychrophila]|uniref:Uncharacterized protein n=1 Tax=Athelia psychrophila TaxID=1759441 RepID=A0A167X8M1_9AGAM|nr:hypothetical protein FIBSPDRAFT_902419 [Fibularhizoctonia sp. CBS 109695]
MGPANGNVYYLESLKEFNAGPYSLINISGHSSRGSRGVSGGRGGARVEAGGHSGSLEGPSIRWEGGLVRGSPVGLRSMGGYVVYGGSYMGVGPIPVITPGGVIGGGTVVVLLNVVYGLLLLTLVFVIDMGNM